MEQEFATHERRGYARGYAAAQVPRVTDLEEFAWTIIANAGEGDWLRESKAWGEAAVRWRTEYHAKLDAAPREPVPEPVAWMYEYDGRRECKFGPEYYAPGVRRITPLYTREGGGT
jgi:hypothetical protein